MIKTYKFCLFYSLSAKSCNSFTASGSAGRSAVARDKIDGLIEFCREFGPLDLMSWQEEYVQLFDYSKCSLHIFEHIKGDSRIGASHGQPDQVYKGAAAPHPRAPDYPGLLGFLATLPAKAAELLGETVHIVVRINEALSRERYRYIFKLSSRYRPKTG